MKPKQFNAQVCVLRFDSSDGDRGRCRLEYAGPMTVFREYVVAPQYQNWATLSLTKFEYFYIRYRGKRYPVESVPGFADIVDFEVSLISNDNPPDLSPNRAREEKLARTLINRGLIKYG